MKERCEDDRTSEATFLHFCAYPFGTSFGFDFYDDPCPTVRDPGNLLEKRDRAAVTCLEFSDLIQGHLSNIALAVGRSIHPFVVDGNQMTISGLLDIELNKISPQGNSFLYGG